jgi:recombination protein RecA
MSKNDKDLDGILAGLSPKVRAMVQKAEEVTLERQPLPSILLTQALEGGIGYGRQTLIWGNKSAGKSALALQIVAMAQKDGKFCAWVDAEESYDPVWATRLGVDDSKLLVSPVKTISDVVEVVTELMGMGIDLIVVDSISSPLPDSYFEKTKDNKERELSELKDTKQIGQESRDWANAVRMMNYANKGTALILISQLRNKIGAYATSKQPTGGEAVMFYSSTVIKLWSNARDDEQIKKEYKYGTKIVKRNVGRTVTWDILYNKTGQPSVSGEYDFYYKGDFVGIDTLSEIVDEAVEYGVIKKSGAWFSYNGSGSLQGKEKIVEWLRENEETRDKIVEEINVTKSG